MHTLQHINMKFCYVFFHCNISPFKYGRVGLIVGVNLIENNFIVGLI